MFQTSLGLRTRYPDAAPVKVLRGRAQESVRVLIPDMKRSDRGFHYVTLVDMVYADVPVVHVTDLCLLRCQWPLSVVYSMSKKQTDLELMRHECKKRFRGERTGNCMFCGTVIKNDMA